MKRVGHLYEQICAFENLPRAATRARRGKRGRPDVAVFHYHLETHLLALREELLTQTYQPGAYRTFPIRDPKPRLISAAPYRDRVVHHAVCQVIEPALERRFSSDSFAHRVGKGTHAAVNRCTHFARRFRYALRCDIEKYYPGIDHTVLQAQLARIIKCSETLQLLAVIIATSPPREPVIRYYPGDDLFTPWARRRGLPIGNLTSQTFSNLYLTGFDRFARTLPGIGGYVRFADDFLLFAQDAAPLHDALAAARDYLHGLRLTLHPRKCQVLPVRCGVPFLGWQVFPDHRRLHRATGVRIQRGLRRLQADYSAGLIELPRVRASVMSWLGHLRHGDTWGLRRALLEACPFSRCGVGR
jgi:hypothetical protein